MKKILITILLSTIYSNTVSAATQPTEPVKNSCKDIIAKTPYYDNSRNLELPLDFYTSSKGAYEKTSDYKKRILAEKKKWEDETAKDAAEFMKKGLLKYKIDLLETYDADKEKLELSPYTISTTKLDGKKFSISITDLGITKSEPYTLGVEKTNRTSRGVGYIAQSKEKFLSGERHLNLKMSGKDAARHHNHYALVVLGEMTSPYTYSVSSKNDDYNTLKISSWTNHYVLIKASCVAVIDDRTKEIIKEF